MTEAFDASPPGQLFRSRVYSKNGVSVNGVALTLKLPSLALVTAVALGVCALLCCFLYWGEYTRHERVGGIASSGFGAMKIYAPTSGIIVRRMVKDGDVVKEDQALFLISTERSTVAMGNASEAIAQELHRRKGALQSDMLLREKLYGVVAEKLQSSVRSNGIQDVRLARALELAWAKARSADAMVQRYRELLASGFASQAALMEKDQDLATQQLGVEDLERQRESLLKDTASLKSQILEAKHQKDLDLSLINRNIADIDQQLVDTDAHREIVVRAQIAGTVTGVLADKGQAVSPASPLLAVLPPGEARDIQLYVPSSASGFVRPGTVVMMRFDAFPYQKFGQYRGIVQGMSLAPLTRSEIPSPVPGNEDYYRVWVRADEPWVLAYGDKIKLQTGMRVEADLLLDRRKIYEWALEPILGFVART
jgi:membrane fusion protein